MLSATFSHKLSISVWTYVAFTGLTFGAGALLVKKLTNDGIDPFTITWIPFLISGALALGTGYRRNQLSKAAVFPGILLGVLAGQDHWGAQPIRRNVSRVLFGFQQ